MRNHESIEKEMSIENPKEFDALIVLGEGWRGGYKHPAGEKLHLNIESKMSALAAGEMFKSGLIDKIIFTGGKTAGEDRPSEAEEMYAFMKKYYPEIPEEVVVLETESVDTADNAEKTSFILDKNNLENVALLAPNVYFPRAQKLFKEYGMTTRPFLSEEMIKTRSNKRSVDHYKKFIKNYQESEPVKRLKIQERILNSLLIIDKKGKIPRILTNIRRK